MCHKRNLTSVPNIFLSSCMCIYCVAKNKGLFLSDVLCYRTRCIFIVYCFVRGWNWGWQEKYSLAFISYLFVIQVKYTDTLIWFNLRRWIIFSSQLFESQGVSAPTVMFCEGIFATYSAIFSHDKTMHPSSCCSLTKKFQCGIKAEGRRKRNHSLGGI